VPCSEGVHNSVGLTPEPVGLGISLDAASRRKLARLTARLNNKWASCMPTKTYAIPPHSSGFVLRRSCGPAAKLNSHIHGVHGRKCLVSPRLARRPHHISRKVDNETRKNSH